MFKQAENNTVVRGAGLIFLIYSLAQILVLSILCGVDNTIYSGQHHFWGFIQAQGLDLFFWLACIFFVCGIILIVFSIKNNEK